MSTSTSATVQTAAPSIPALVALQKDLLALLEVTRTAAIAYGRPDLAERIDRAAVRNSNRELTVMVVGEFKQGKSTLVNALLNAPVCGVADDVSTIVPTIVRYGAELGAIAHYEGDDARDTSIEFGEVALLGSEQGNPGNRAGIRSIDVAIPRKLLQPGLCLVDTPGVGGLESTHGAATMAALGLAEAILFVSDASQPLSNSELDFLRHARSRCPNVTLVQSKIDIYSSWRRVVELNRAYLAQAEMDVEIVAVSSILRQRATAENSKELNEESGYPPLLELLRDAASGDAARLAARTTLGDVLFVAEQLRSSFESERQILEDPNSLAQVVAQLEKAKEHADKLRGQSAKWQQTLNDGTQDLASDLDHDLRLRFRAITAEAEKVLDTHDPAEMWDDFEQWLHQRIGFDLGSHYQLIADRADELAGRVAQHFADDEAELGLVSMSRPVPSIRAKNLGAEMSIEVVGVTGNALAAVRGSYGGVLMFGMMGQMVGLAMMNPFSLVFGVGLGRKAYRDEKKRQLMQRQQQAKMAMRKYLDDLNVESGKNSRDTTRQVQRDLRDEFAQRAEQLQTTIRDSLKTAEASTKVVTGERQRRLTDVRAELDRIAKLTQHADTLAAKLGPVTGATAS